MNIGKFIKEVDIILKKEDDISCKLNTNVFKKINENASNNIISQVQKINKYKLEIEQITKSIDKVKLIEVFNHILNKVAKGDIQFIVDSSSTITYKNNKNYRVYEFFYDNGEWCVVLLEDEGGPDVQSFLRYISVENLCVILDALLKADGVSFELNKETFKKINENTILNFNGFLINEKLDFPNILNKSKEIFQKESELNRLLSVLEDDDIIDVIEYILSKVSDNNRLDLDSDIIVFTNNLKNYSIDSFYSKYANKLHWQIELVDPPYKMSPTNIELYALDTMSLVKVLNALLVNDKVSGLLNTDVFKKINEGVESAPAETRLNIFKNFNHFNKDQMGGMEIFAPRVNTEINRMSDELYNDDIDDDDEIEDEGRDENGEPTDVINGFDDDDTGLVINKKDKVHTPRRTLNYPYGMDNNPEPSFKLDNTTQSKGKIIFRFADYRGINNFR